MHWEIKIPLSDILSWILFLFDEMKSLLDEIAQAIFYLWKCVQYVGVDLRATNTLDKEKTTTTTKKA